MWWYNLPNLFELISVSVSVSLNIYIYIYIFDGQLTLMYIYVVSMIFILISPTQLPIVENVSVFFMQMIPVLTGFPLDDLSVLQYWTKQISDFNFHLSIYLSI